jgi:hypothetical protein
MPKDLKATLDVLTDIDGHVEHVALGTETESDVNVLAHAIHSLIDVVRELATEQSRG